MVNILQSYKQAHSYLTHFTHLVNALLKDEGSAQDNHLVACNFAKYSQI